MSTVTLLYVTAPDDTVAKQIAHTLVEEKLAACVNLLGAMESIYRWEGAITHAQEVAMLVKTTPEKAEAATARIAALHPHECPAILALPVQGGFSPFLTWVAAETMA